MGGTMGAQVTWCLARTLRKSSGSNLGTVTTVAPTRSGRFITTTIP